MLRFNHIVKTDAECFTTLTLTFDQRVKSRQRIALDNGRIAGLFLPRGTVLQHGQKIQAETGQLVEIMAAVEAVSSVYVSDALMIARSCYHLGNRHVPLQIAEGFIRYQHDHVLDDMIRGLGLEVTVEKEAFEPEAGAYGEHKPAAHEHPHSHQHD
ncbi:MAG: urease accessory protein UreE [Gammaproteobacteria bacterium]|nr:urease accessory protein UreE [Gammaproteobacteria bacterium]